MEVEFGSIENASDDLSSMTIRCEQSDLENEQNRYTRFDLHLNSNDKYPIPMGPSIKFSLWADHGEKALQPRVVS